MLASPTYERRCDLHRDTLIEVGIKLQRHLGTEYAKQFLTDVNIPDPTIERVLSTKALRKRPALSLDSGFVS